MPTLGLAMIVKNSEKTIKRCLDSCYHLFDEIIIVDTGSIDRTKEIALQYTNKVYDFVWIDDFAAARNFSFSLVSTDYIMWLDSDDEILPKDRQKINNLDYTDKEVIICRYQYSHDQYGVVECSLERERIVKRSLGLRWEKSIHEYISFFGKKISVEDIEIHHWKQSGTSERNLKILERLTKKDPVPRNLFYLGKEYYDFSKFELSIQKLEKFVKMDGWWEDVFAAYRIIAKAYLALKNEVEFFKNIFMSIKIEPRVAEPYYELASYYFAKKDWHRAIYWYELCLNSKRPAELLSTYYPQYYTWSPAIQLVLCYNNIGNVQKAYEYNELFLSFRPKDVAGLNNRNILTNSPLRLKRKNGQGKKLNLGCGNKRIEGYVNVDIVKIDEVDEVFSLYEIPYSDNTISAISSEHALEHVSLEHAKQALQEWFRVLLPGGELKLYIPDLELCCEGYLKGDNSRKINGFPEKEWYTKCLYGIQRDENGSVAQYQFHLCNFSKKEIRELLESIGFIIDSLENY